MAMSQMYIKDGEEYKEVQGFTQTELDEVVGKRLERERAKFSDYADLKAQVEGFSAKEQELNARMSEIEAEKNNLSQQLEQANLNVEKTKILREFNIPADLEEFVSGIDADEMRKRAEKLSKNTTKSIQVEKHEKPNPKTSEFSNVAKGLFGREQE